MATQAVAPHARRGFTLIELIVVMAIIALLVSIVAPRYYRTVDKARDASLKTTLNVVRDAIDKYAADRDKYPDSLDELVNRGYLRQLPEDPVTGSLNAGLAQWLIGSGLAPARYVAAQGAALGRAGRVHVQQEGADVWIGGDVTPVVQGQISL